MQKSCHPRRNEQFENKGIFYKAFLKPKYNVHYYSGKSYYWSTLKRSNTFINKGTVSDSKNIICRMYGKIRKGSSTFLVSINKKQTESAQT